MSDTEKTITVMLIDEQQPRAALLERALLDAGYDVVCRQTSTQGLEANVDQYEPDLIIIDVDSPDRDTLESMASLNKNNPHPMVMFTENDDLDTIERAIKSGVSAYVSHGLQADRVKGIIEVAITRFREYQALKDELLHTKSQLADRKIIERAKGILMSQRNLSEDNAYKAMREMSMNKGLRLVDISKSIIDVFELLDKPCSQPTLLEESYE